MAQSGYTPIQLYRSTTASAVPAAGNLAAGELALNTVDEKLYFKNAAGTVKLLAASSSATATVSSVDQTFTGGLISVTGAPITTSGTLALTVAGTSGGIPYFSSGSTWASSAALAANAIVIGGGAGAAPATTTTGTGVLTALGNAVNAAGGVTTVDGTATLTNKTLTDPAIIGTVLEDVFTITDAVGFEVDPGNGSIQLITLGASRTPKATNFAAGESVTLMVDDGAAYTLTWTDTTWGPSGVIWETNAGVAPTLSTTGYTTIVLWKVSTQVYGARVGDA